MRCNPFVRDLEFTRTVAEQWQEYELCPLQHEVLLFGVVAAPPRRGPNGNCKKCSSFAYIVTPLCMIPGSAGIGRNCKDSYGTGMMAGMARGEYLCLLSI